MVGWREGGLWMWLGHDHGGAGLVAGLNDPEGLLQPWCFCDYITWALSFSCQPQRAGELIMSLSGATGKRWITHQCSKWSKGPFLPRIMKGSSHNEPQIQPALRLPALLEIYFPQELSAVHVYMPAQFASWGKNLMPQRWQNYPDPKIMWCSAGLGFCIPQQCPGRWRDGYMQMGCWKRTELPLVTSGHGHRNWYE